MADSIVFNGKPRIMTEGDLPCLVTYEEHRGGSYLSVALIANLFMRGSKILFLTAYPMATGNFLAQVGPDHTRLARVGSRSSLEAEAQTQAIILESGNESLCIEALQSLADVHERVLFVKNIEVWGDSVIEACLKHEKILLSGNIDASPAKEKILKMNFKTLIAFNQPKAPLPIAVPTLEKYAGFLVGTVGNGIIPVKKQS